MKIFFSVLILCAVLISCGKKDTKTEVKELKNVSSGKIEFKMKEFKKSVNNCNIDSAGCTYIDMKYPEILNEDIKAKVNGYISSFLRDSIYQQEGELNNSLDELAMNFFADFEKLKKISPVPDMSYSLEANSEIISETPGYFTLTISYYIFTGGAHPNSYLKYTVFGKTTGDVLTLNDIFKPGYENILNRMVDSTFRKEKGLSMTEDLTKAGLFENKITYSDNFALSEDSIKFYYNNYEIAPYVYGPAQIAISLDNLKSYIKE
ncbi:MAG: DUF3298 and DUF4163 domain-containing protein [Bacteroidetes bacterium]|nr:DUF3298 and DUF4163 domain-containing protein [Bacteroidota bacterium]